MLNGLTMNDDLCFLIFLGPSFLVVIALSCCYVVQNLFNILSCVVQSLVNVYKASSTSNRIIQSLVNMLSHTAKSLVILYRKNTLSCT